MSLFEQLIVSLREVQEQIRQVMKPSEEEGLTHAQLFLLFMIYRQGRIKTTDISAYFDITPGAATVIADKLENLGLIKRERDKKDRRVVVITLSEQGLKFLEKKRSENLKRLEEILKDFSREEILTTIQLLHKMTDAIAKYQSTGK